MRYTPEVVKLIDHVTNLEQRIDVLGKMLQIVDECLTGVKFGEYDTDLRKDLANELAVTKVNKMVLDTVGPPPAPAPKQRARPKKVLVTTDDGSASVA